MDRPEAKKHDMISRALYCVAGMALIGCQTKSTATPEILLLKKNREGTEAVLARKNLHTTVAFQYEIHLKRDGEARSAKSLVLEGQRMEPGLEVSWIKERLLLVKYRQGSITSFKNKRWIRIGKELVEYEVVLKKVDQ